MLTREDWDAINAMVNGEYTVQVEDALWEAVLAGVNLARAVIAKEDEDLHDQALRYLLKFSNWRTNWKNFHLSPDDLRQLRVWNYGESETDAIEEEEKNHGETGGKPTG